MTIKVQVNETIMDIALVYNSPLGFVLLLEDNPDLMPDQELEPGMELFVDDAKIQNPIKVQPIKKAVRKEKEILVVDNQNLIDVAIQYYGSAEGLKYVLEDNPDFHPGVAPEKQAPVRIRRERVINKQMLDLVNKNGLVIATGTDLTEPEGNYWITEFNEIVIDENNNKVITE